MKNKKNRSMTYMIPITTEQMGIVAGLLQVSDNKLTNREINEKNKFLNVMADALTKSLEETE